MLLLGSGAVAPFRFGNTFEHEEELREAIETAGLAAKLEKVAGCVELTVHVPLVRERRSGREYLLAKKRELDLAERLHAKAAPLLEDWRQENKGDGIQAACLVKTARVSQLKETLRTFEPQPKVTGPWPPSSFV